MTAGAVGSRAWARLSSPWWATPAGAALAAGTLVRGAFTADAFVFAAVQLVLVALAVVDLETRRLPNLVTIPTSLFAVGLRGLFEPGAIGSAVIAGTAALVAVAALSVILRGAIGMGDAKLAGMLGFLLASAVLPALVIGTLLGGVGSVGLLALGRARWKTAIAYGPYLALGGAIAILVSHPPALV